MGEIQQVHGKTGKVCWLVVLSREAEKICITTLFNESGLLFIRKWNPQNPGFILSAVEKKNYDSCFLS